MDDPKLEYFADYNKDKCLNLCRYINNATRGKYKADIAHITHNGFNFYIVSIDGAVYSSLTTNCLMRVARFLWMWRKSRFYCLDTHPHDYRTVIQGKLDIPNLYDDKGEISWKYETAEYLPKN